jgi:hypothetical protein
MNGIYKMRSWVSRGHSYHALGVPREIAESYGDEERFAVERLKDGSIVYTPFRAPRHGDFAPRAKK